MLKIVEPKGLLLSAITGLTFAIALSTLPSNAQAQTTASSTSSSAATPEQLSRITPTSPDALTAPTDIQSLQSELRSQKLTQNVTSVSQLSDVKPTDWAFTALQSLVERYGCIAGYPDSTFRGNQATSRYEFAAGLNACLDKINEIISAGLADKVSKEDLETLQRLQEEFAAELTALRGRVDALESKTAQLEAQQFSTTTKLTGEAILSLAAASGGPNDARSNVVLGNRTRLLLNSTFTGKDSLRVRFEAGNNFAGNSGTSTFSSLLGTNSARIGTGSSTSDNSFVLNLLDYKFPIFDNKVTLYVAPISFPDEFFTVLSPVASNGQGSISRFGRFDPLMRIAGTSSLFAFDWNISDRVRLQAGYGASNTASPAPGGQGGLFGGSTLALVQFIFKPADNLDASVAYANTYHQGNNLSTGLVNTPTSESISGAGISSIRANSLSGNLAWRFAPKVTFHTWGSIIFADAVNVNASTTFTTWLAGLTFNDLFSEGSAASILFGQPIKRTSVGGIAGGLPSATPYHLELFYRFRVSKNISVTPGIFWVFNPEGLSGAPTATVGLIRTTFSF